MSHHPGPAPSAHAADVLRDRVAWVTGGGRGLGRAYALALARAGARVAVTARSAEELADTVQAVTAAGGLALAAPADVTQRGQVERAAALVQSGAGPVDILVNAAGSAGPAGPIWASDPDQWWGCVEANLRGALLCAASVLPAMVARGSGRVINVTSAAARWAAPHHSAYICSKTALTRLSETMAADLAGRGVSVFSLEPGTVRTAMTEELMRSPYMQPLRQAFALGRDVAPEASAALVVWLASGQGDALSGLVIGCHDDVARLLGGQQAIRELGLQALRVAPFGRRRAVLFACGRPLRWLQARRRARR